MKSLASISSLPLPTNMSLPEAWSRAAGKLHGLLSGLIIAISNLVLGAIAFLAFYFAGKGIRFLVTRMTRSRRKHHNVTLVLGRLAQGATFIFGLLVAAVIIFPNFTPTSLIQLLGIGSVAFGFAFRDVLQNYLAGIILLLTEPFRIGDQIVFGAYEGTVEDIQTRATLIKTYDGRRVVIPNGQLFTSSFIVNTAFAARRIEYDVGIGYGDDIELAKRLIFERLAQIERVLRDPEPEVLTHDLADSWITLRVRWWIRSPRMQDLFKARDEVIAAIRAGLTRHGIDLPYPTRQILFHDQTEQTDGDRRAQREGWPARGKNNPAPARLATPGPDPTPLGHS